jgi:hypothetical protein
VLKTYPPVSFSQPIDTTERRFGISGQQWATKLFAHCMFINPINDGFFDLSGLSGKPKSPEPYLPNY